MPVRAPTVCRRPGCPGLVRNGVCDRCGPARRVREREFDERRGSSSSRGYDYAWQKLRERFLITHFYCVHCAARGVMTAATDVHHVVARRDGGSDDDSNLLALCHACHSRVTAAGG